ncbi:fibronectin type III domain-containing protein 1-like isoform X2 [Patiria miniata]|uniref:Fibronectin type-III domain-containing protein n=1 Tax=Patiria miniata TaxID=46514 RepID=A0A913Z186_PATMI|nr:fibronectin type III domain-containing protein 1-like isoform X2 [Patiria miniata]
MSLNWRRNDYFERLLEDGPSSHSALELLVDDLHRDKAHTIGAFLDHYGSEDFMWGLVRMLSAENTRVAGNSAYIFGTVAESVEGQRRVLSLVNGPHPHNVLADLTNMLDYDDDESVMNAAGTLGTLAESSGGREWMLKEPCLQVTISRVTGLLTSNNVWTASNAALVLARVSIAEEGCQMMLDHNFSHQIMTKLIDSLGIDEAGRGMNAAFALGRLCDLETGRVRLLQHPDSEKMMSRLCSMLASKDSGCGKNACYAISCLATSAQGHGRLLGHKSSEVMLQRLGSQLSNEDSETAWFAAMTLRTLASKRAGCLRLRNHSHVVPALQIVQCRGPSHQDLKDEVELTLELLKTLHQPPPPRLQVKGHGEIFAEWDEVALKSGLEVTYRLYNDSEILYDGKSLSHLVTGLRADTQYSFRLQLSTEGDDSPLSEVAVATTEESPPDTPQGLRILAVTISQLKLGWAPPEFNNGALKGYVVYNGKQPVETTTELSSIVSGLTPGTTYDLHVCAFNHKGKGPKATITATTTELGKHAPGKPSLTVRGRSEIHVTWTPPEFPLGRLHRFELTQNGKVIYSGTELSYTAHRLTPNTEYKFTVIAVTSEGKCESDAAKKKTPKDEYNVQSTAPIFFSHPVRMTEETPGKSKDKSSRAHSRHGRKRSAKQRHLKQPISPTYTEPPSLRSSSRPSSGFSDDSYHAKTHSRQKQSAGGLEKRGSKSSTTMEPLAEWSSERSSTSSSETGEDDDEERWPGADHLSYRTSSTSHGRHRKPQDGASSKRGTSGGSHSRTSPETSRGLDRDTSKSSNKGHRESIKKTSTEMEHEYERSTKTERSNSDEVKPQVRGQAKVNSKESNDHSNANQRYADSSREASAQKPSKTTMQYVKTKRHAAGHHGDQESDPVAFKLDRLLRSLKSTTTRKTSLNSHRAVGPGKDGLQRTPTSVTWDPRLSSSVGSNSHVAKRDLKLDGVPPSREIATSGKEFTLLANGQIVYRDSRSGSGTSKKSSSSSEATTMTTVKSDKKPSKEKRRTSTKASQGDTSLQPLHPEGFTATESHIPDIFPWDGGDVSKVSTAPPASWITQTRTALADNAIPFRSALADYSSFYQRANSIISSHRPTLKKNLAKLASYPGAFPIQQGVTAIQYEPDFPASKPVATNKYQFIPTQYRTQPTNLPGQPMHRGPTSANLYDKSAYAKKLEALSQLSTDRKAGLVCHECTHDHNEGRTTPKAMVALKYSHRNDLSVSVGGAKTKSSPVPDIAS